MRELPALLLRAPSFFYGAAILAFVCSIGLTMLDLKAVMPEASRLEPLFRVGVLRGIFQSALEALYIAANGVVAHILLAIWSNTRAAAAEGVTHD